MRRTRLCWLLALLASHSVFGQTACPAGVAPGSPQCGPDSGTSRGEPPAPRYTGEWIKTWGAIASADNSDEAWASTGMLSKALAEKDAVDQCNEAGFKVCVAHFTYRNQCVAVASSSSKPVKSSMNSGPDLNETKQASIESCTSRGGIG
ncbi:DUF4189 domain-containing protein [Pseudomonas quasicaspiana]|uniref:DUF4189 domain-containing protein n=1 Tax=Pseudomonas quasicaspiana TaxID=2829821 RepID=UPI003873A1D9|nr:DUF4189 domain-containing protein [Pseudomonas quasicaspiana]